MLLIYGVILKCFRCGNKMGVFLKGWVLYRFKFKLWFLKCIYEDVFDVICMLFI